MTTPKTVTLPRAFRLAAEPRGHGVIDVPGTGPVTVPPERLLRIVWWPGGKHASHWRAAHVAGGLETGRYLALEGA